MGRVESGLHENGHVAMLEAGGSLEIKFSLLAFVFFYRSEDFLVLLFFYGHRKLFPFPGSIEREREDWINKKKFKWKVALARVKRVCVVLSASEARSPHVATASTLSFWPFSLLALNWNISHKEKFIVLLLLAMEFPFLQNSFLLQSALQLSIALCWI